MRLFFRRHGSGLPLLILHGLFGSSNNWNTLAKRLGEHFTVYAVDLRNHGHSPHDPVHTYPSMAADILEFMDQEGISSSFLLGHSMGGKVGMEIALSHPSKIGKLVVVDIAPVPYPDRHDALLSALISLPLDDYSSRAQADDALRKEVPDERVRGFLLTNLRRTEQGTYTWALNLHALKVHRADLAAGIQEGRQYNGPALFIRGDRSDYVLPQYHDAIKRLFPSARFETIPGAGHWVHADAPEAFLEAVLSFL
ncbi:MAG: alpha/beta fold hydrolase [Bacteroidota bacterium]